MSLRSKPLREIGLAWNFDALWQRTQLIGFVRCLLVEIFMSLRSKPLREIGLAWNFDALWQRTQLIGFVRYDR
jgi:hypothetical protein